jgi:hypothetical protein
MAGLSGQPGPATCDHEAGANDRGAASVLGAGGWLARFGLVAAGWNVLRRDLAAGLPAGCAPRSGIAAGMTVPGVVHAAPAPACACPDGGRVPVRARWLPLAVADSSAAITATTMVTLAVCSEGRRRPG